MTSLWPAEVFRGRMHHDIGAERERLLQHRRRECAVAEHHCPVAMRRFDDSGDIGYLQLWIGRCFEPESHERRRRRISRCQRDHSCRRAVCECRCVAGIRPRARAARCSSPKASATSCRWARIPATPSSQPCPSRTRVRPRRPRASRAPSRDAPASDCLRARIRIRRRARRPGRDETSSPGGSVAR